MLSVSYMKKLFSVIYLSFCIFLPRWWGGQSWCEIRLGSEKKTDLQMGTVAQSYWETPS